eukprot:11850199-Heterocapsa_arctica.AAC.1
MQQPISTCPIWAAACHSMTAALIDVMSWTGSQADLATCNARNAPAMVCGSPALRQVLAMAGTAGLRAIATRILSPPGLMPQFPPYLLATARD